MGVVQFLIGIIVQPPSPAPEPARTMTQRIIRVQHDPVHAVIGTSHQVPVPLGEVISHSLTVEPARTSDQDISQTP
jgi:hypothetical protein